MPRIKFRICEHLVISHLTDKKVKINSNRLIAIQDTPLKLQLPLRKIP